MDTDADDAQAEGWPLPLSESLMMAAPLVYDVDGSGTLDIIVATEVYCSQRQLALNVASVGLSALWMYTVLTVLNVASVGFSLVDVYSVNGAECGVGCLAECNTVHNVNAR